MFDQLHDPNPPEVTSRHLAVVAERAAGMRRRRNAVAGSLGVAALVGAGTVGLAVAQRDSVDEAPVAATAEELPATAEPIDADQEASPTTTVLDPSSLPPAVPVNPDPNDLPPAVPVNTDPDDGTTGTNDDAAAGSDSSSDATDTSESSPDPADDPVGDAGDDTIDLATAAALRSADPLVAVTATDAGVWFSASGPDAVSELLVFGHGVERIDFLGDGTATVESRPGGSLIELIGTDGVPLPSLRVGTSHAVGPDGSAICGLDGTGTLIVCSNAGGAELLTTPFDRADVIGTDLTWFDDRTVLVLGRYSTAWSLSVIDIPDGTVTTRPFARLADFGSLRFAGSSNGELVVHDAGTERVLVGALDDYGDAGPDDPNATSLAVRDLGAPMRSVWYDGSEEILVDRDGVLTVDGEVIPGTYVSARR